MGKEITDQEKSEYLAYKTFEDFLRNCQYGIDQLKQEPLQKFQNIILICGAMVAFDKGVCNFLNILSRKYGKLFLLSEVTAENRRYTKEKINFSFLCTPHLLAKEIVIYGMDIPTEPYMYDKCKEKKYLSEAVNNIETRHIGLGEGYAVVWAYYASEYIELLLTKLQPWKVILWNEFYAFHHIFKGICEERKIPVSYIEFGCLPGTICIEDVGQQGESMVSQKPRKFLRLNVGMEEINNAEKVLKFLKETGLNRNSQPDITLKTNILNPKKEGKRKILYFGQNDYESGLYPYTKDTLKYHSPVFKSTLEALEYLRLICISEDWDLIFKPHPIIAALGHNEWETMEDVSVVGEVNINHLIDLCDVSVTILSQAAYIALIRERPVVMLGYTQLKNKGCTYEAFSKNKIKYQLKNALKIGFSEKQKTFFIKHIAQLLKYYLYDDLTHEEFKFGKKIEEMTI